MKYPICAGLIVGLLMSPISMAAESNDNLSTTNQAQSKSPKELGELFLQQNKGKKGVVTLPDGLQYKILKQGNGPKPSSDDIVTVNYEGKLINGTEFDSSAKHGGPAKFPVSQVIPGWVEAIQLMPVGSTWEIYVPEHLAYGDRGAPPSIGPNETLIFKINLLNAEKQ